MLILMFICSLRTQNYYCYVLLHVMFVLLCDLLMFALSDGCKNLECDGASRQASTCGWPTSSSKRCLPFLTGDIMLHCHILSLPKNIKELSQLVPMNVNECQWPPLGTIVCHCCYLMTVLSNQWQNGPECESPHPRAEVVDEGFNPTYGARPLRRAIMRLVEDELAESFLNDSDQKWSESGQLEGTYPPIIG